MDVTVIGETLIQEGDINDALYIVLRGRLDAYTDTIHTSTMEAGSFFGEQVLLTSAPLYNLYFSWDRH